MVNADWVCCPLSVECQKFTSCQCWEARIPIDMTLIFLSLSKVSKTEITLNDKSFPYLQIPKPELPVSNPFLAHFQHLQSWWDESFLTVRTLTFRDGKYMVYCIKGKYEIKSLWTFPNEYSLFLLIFQWNLGTWRIHMLVQQQQTKTFFSPQLGLTKKNLLKVITYYLFTKIYLISFTFLIIYFTMGV